MEDESIHNNPWDEAKDIFSKLEEQVVDISHNMTSLMENLENKFGPFGKVGGSNLEFRSDEK
jgi:hypothetical protein